MFYMEENRFGDCFVFFCFLMELTGDQNCALLTILIRDFLKNHLYDHFLIFINSYMRLLMRQEYGQIFGKYLLSF